MSRITYHVARIKTIGILIVTLLLSTTYFLQPTAVSAAMWHCTACSCDCNTDPFTPAHGTITWPYPGDSVDPEGACVTACRTACGEGRVFVPTPDRIGRVEIDSGVRDGRFIGSGLTCAVVPGTETPEATPTPSTTAPTPGMGDGGEDRTSPSDFGLRNPIGSTDLRTIISRIIRAVLGVVGAIFLVMFVYGGVQWMTAGDSKRIDSAKKTLVNAVIGMIIVAFSYSIVSLVFSLAGQVTGGG